MKKALEPFTKEYLWCKIVLVINNMILTWFYYVWCYVNCRSHFAQNDYSFQFLNAGSYPLVTADRLSSKIVSLPVPYHVAFCCNSCQQQNVYYICMMCCWWCAIYLMFVWQNMSKLPSVFLKMVREIHEWKSHFLN